MATERNNSKRNTSATLHDLYNPPTLHKEMKGVGVTRNKSPSITHIRILHHDLSHSRPRARESCRRYENIFSSHFEIGGWVGIRQLRSPPAGLGGPTGGFIIMVNRGSSTPLPAWVVRQGEFIIVVNILSASFLGYPAPPEW